MSNQSAGLLLFRRTKGLEIMLVHPGGPFWKNKDECAWSIPKGEFSDEEDPLDAAKREFQEETGFEIDGKFIPLQPIKQKSGKWIRAWAIDKDLDVSTIESNLFEMEWPPRSGKTQKFPEVDKAVWFDLAEAKQKINPAQASLIDQLITLMTNR